MWVVSNFNGRRRSKLFLVGSVVIKFSRWLKVIVRNLISSIKIRIFRVDRMLQWERFKLFFIGASWGKRNMRSHNRFLYQQKTYSNIFQPWTIQFLILIGMRFLKSLLVSGPQSFRIVVSFFNDMFRRFSSCNFMMNLFELAIVRCLELSFNMWSWTFMFAYIICIPYHNYTSHKYICIICSIWSTSADRFIISEIDLWCQNHGPKTNRICYLPSPTLQ